MTAVTDREDVFGKPDPKEDQSFLVASVEDQMACVPSESHEADVLRRLDEFRAMNGEPNSIRLDEIDPLKDALEARHNEKTDEDESSDMKQGMSPR